MSEAKVAKRYAVALMDLWIDRDQREVAAKQLDEFLAAFDSSDALRMVLLSPVIGKEEKRGLLEALVKKLRLTVTLRNFVLVLLDHDRLAELPGVARELRALIDTAEDRVSALVTSAVALDKTEVEAIRKEAERLTGKQVVVTTRVDLSLIGGVVTQIGNIVLDGSVRTDLEMLRESLQR